jgi:hypothetical protein
MAFLLTCFLLSATCTSCIPPKSDPQGKVELTWQEPIWRSTGAQEIRLQFKFAPGDTAEYQDNLRATIYSEGKTTEWEHSVTLQYHVKGISDEGTAQALLSGKNLDKKGEGRELFEFLPRSLHNLGNFSISPSGHMTNITGLIGFRSLPTFPNDSLKIGSKWADTVGLLITPILPKAIMTGKCTYHLIGLADVRGHKWAKITFEGDLELGKQEVMQKVIGVKWAGKPVQEGRGVRVGEVVVGSPAEKAGILPGDKILSFGGMTVNTWLDLISAIAMSSHDKSATVIVLRGNGRKKLTVKPQVASSGQIEIKGSIKGMFVFDVTMGAMVRMQISPFSRRTLIEADDKTTDREVHINSLTQLVKYSMLNRPHSSQQGGN